VQYLGIVKPGLKPSGIAVLLAALLLSAAIAAGQAVTQAELKSRMQAAAEAQQADDPVRVSQANRRLIAFALAQFSDLRMLQGDAKRAAELCAQAIQLEDALDRRYRCAAAMALSGDVDGALQQASVLVAQDPNNALAWSMQGKLLTTKKEFKPAAEALTKSLALQFDPEVAYVLATDFISLHDKPNADAVFQRLAEVGVNRARLHVMAGRAYEEANLPDDAEREYKQAIALDPKSRGHYFLGLFYLSRNGWESTPQARQEFASEVAQNPDDFFGNYFLGYLASGDKDYDISDRYLKVAAASKPDWPEPFLYMGLNAYGRGDNKSAEELLRRAIQLTGSDEGRNNYQIRRAFFTLGRILIQSGQKEEGTKLVEKSKAMETKLVIDSRPRALDTNASAADSGAKQSRPGDSGNAAGNTAPLTAEQTSQAAQAEKTLSAILGNAYNDLGTSEARRQDYAAALEHFREAEKWNAETPGLWRNIGLAAFLSGEYAESARALPHVVANDPSDRRSQSMLAMSLYMLKDYSAAAKVFDVIPNEALADPRMSFAWAETLAQTKNPQRATEILGKLMEQPMPAPMLVRAGQLYASLGDRARAASCYQKAREQDPSITIPH
jgi:tetratricopeptide (TPR) repeat protein